MRVVAYQDSEGRNTYRSIPDDKPDSYARYGQLVGPPEFDDFLPKEVSVRLTNELFNRGIISKADMLKKGNRNHIEAALKAALAVDVERIMVEYQEL